MFFIKQNMPPVDFLKIHPVFVAVLVKSADLLTPSEPDAGSSAPDGNI